MFYDFFDEINIPLSLDRRDRQKITANKTKTSETRRNCSKAIKIVKLSEKWSYPIQVVRNTRE